ncbi:hypothetical protein [Peredibacter starrii]|uniref:Uncharacterized protein n=1 Tax=Peredibacter starrii TaxID=28202 RepID=A0AAX4HUS4_9BACT|nr:hypothetical protein [Peredibacter starrii]WPU67120.1 hypothetical protein SOO65_10175 [Peredibacter starrii]
MDLNQLFHLKETLLKELEAEVAKMEFASTEERTEYYDKSMEVIINFYSRAIMKTILDPENSKSKAA